MDRIAYMWSYHRMQETTQLFPQLGGAASSVAIVHAVPAMGSGVADCCDLHHTGLRQRRKPTQRYSCAGGRFPSLSIPAMEAAASQTERAPTSLSPSIDSSTTENNPHHSFVNLHLFNQLHSHIYIYKICFHHYYPPTPTASHWVGEERAETERERELVFSPSESINFDPSICRLGSFRIVIFVTLISCVRLSRCTSGHTVKETNTEREREMDGGASRLGVISSHPRSNVMN